MRSRPLLLAIAGVILLTGCEESVSDKVFGARVRAYLLAHPEVLQEAAKKLDEKDLAEQERKHAEQARKTEAAIPRYRAAIERDPRDFVANPNGKITVTEFFDYKCGYCKGIAPDVLKLIAENPDVRFVFKEFPILSPVSESAARAALAARGRGNAYLELHKDLISSNSLAEADIDRILQENGIDPAAARALGADDAVSRHLADNHKLATDLGINGTPNFIVGDTLVGGADLRALRAAIARARRS